MIARVLVLLFTPTMADAQVAAVALVPRPAMMQPAAGTCRLGPRVTVAMASGSPGAPPTAYLRNILESAGLTLIPASDPSIRLELSATLERTCGAEGYLLKIGPQGLSLRAAEPAGLFYGIQTLRQMLTVESRQGTAAAPFWELPCMDIQDRPRFQWRGMLLDCCRHFMTKEFVMRTIDLLAYHKMNVLHWHLTEDQGWRIEIRKYPRLTEVGAWRTADGVRYGGFYTQQDIREVVAYARSRHVTIVPEIEMPGHALAALAAYPELSCSGGPFSVGTRWGVYDDVYCAGNDRTFSFLQDVLDEVLELFPSRYIHVGGDECPKVRWQQCSKCQARIASEGLKDEHQLQSYFLQRMERYLSQRGRRLIGWDEILEGGLPQGATVQSWRGMEGAIAAARSGHDVVSSPTSHCYFDYPLRPHPDAPSWMGVISLEKVYSFEPTPAELSAAQAAHVLGAEGNVWTERAPQPRVDERVFPRLCALAEVTWSPAAGRDWPDFSRRMHTHYRRLDRLGVTYDIEPPRCSDHPARFRAGMEVRLSNPLGNGRIHYTVDGSEPTVRSPQYGAALRLDHPLTIRARIVLDGGRSGAIAEYSFEDHPLERHGK